MTICTSDGRHCFGEIIDKQMRLNEAGVFAQNCWQQIPLHSSSVILDEYVIMPNHVHGLIMIKGEWLQGEGTGSVDPNQNIGLMRNDYSGKLAEYQHLVPGSVGVIVRGFKSAVTRWFRLNTGIKVVWQRNFYDHIVRDENELSRIRSYIIQNPAKWHFDRQNRDSKNIAGEPDAVFNAEPWMI
ncbi:MAG: transposase [Candidatus Riflebacteria bacterium]